MTTPKEILKLARELISEEKHWDKGAFATREGRVLSADEYYEADCFCVMGAVRRADQIMNKHYHVHYGNLSEPTALLAKDLPPFTDTEGNVLDYVDERVYQFNDNATHAQVLAHLDKVIAELGDEV